MKFFDALLVSFTVGLCLTTGYLFTSDYPGPGPTILDPPALPVRAIVIHDRSVAHADVVREPPFHVSMEPNPVFSRYWEAADAAPHTGLEEWDATTLSVAIDGQTSIASLVELLAALCPDYELPPTRIASHGELDPSVVCPGSWLDMGALRAEVDRELRTRGSAGGSRPASLPTP